jgi:hypothetical protein
LNFAAFCESIQREGQKLNGPETTNNQTDIMKHLLAPVLALATAALISFGSAPTAQAGDSHCRVHSNCGNCHKAVYSHYRPVRYVNSRAVYGWVPRYHSNCGRTPVQVYNYGYGTPVTRYYTYPSVRCYNVYGRYPTSQAISGFGSWR